MKESSIIFDGECNLCNGIVGWLLKRAPKGTFLFIPFQSPYGQELLKQHGLPTNQLETVILFDENGKHTLSNGFLTIISKIPQWKWVASLLLYIPQSVRDIIYTTTSKHRVLWFGKSQACLMVNSASPAT